VNLVGSSMASRPPLIFMKGTYMTNREKGYEMHRDESNLRRNQDAVYQGRVKTLREVNLKLKELKKVPDKSACQWKNMFDALDIIEIIKQRKKGNPMADFRRTYKTKKNPQKKKPSVKVENKEYDTPQGWAKRWQSYGEAMQEINRKKKNPEVRDTFGKVVSKSRNLAGVHRYAAKVQASRVTIAKLSNGGGRIWIHFVNGAEFIENFASYTVLLGHIANWRALQGVKLYYKDSVSMGPITPGNRNLITHMTRGRSRRGF